MDIHITKNSKYLDHNQDTNYMWRITIESHKHMTCCHYRIWSTHSKMYKALMELDGTSQTYV